MMLTAWQVAQIAEIVQPMESVEVSVIEGVAMVQVFSSGGELALLELMPPTNSLTPHLYLTDFGVVRNRPREVA